MRPLSTTKANAFVGAGGLCSNATDLVQWMRALIDGKVVSPGSLHSATAAPVGAGFTPPYGYGLSLKPLVGQRAVWHIGSMSGFMSVLAYFPDQDVIIAALANRRRAPVDALVKKIARALLDLRPAFRDLPVPAAERARSIGNYDDGMFKFKVYQQGEQLYVDVPPLGPPLRLRYQGAHELRRRSLARAASGSSRPRVPLSASTGNGLNCGRSGAAFSRSRGCEEELRGRPGKSYWSVPPGRVKYDASKPPRSRQKGEVPAERRVGGRLMAESLLVRRTWLRGLLVGGFSVGLDADVRASFLLRGREPVSERPARQDGRASEDGPGMCLVPSAVQRAEHASAVVAQRQRGGLPPGAKRRSLPATRSPDSGQLSGLRGYRCGSRSR